MDGGANGWTVRDAGSTNGSWLDGAPLAPGIPLDLRDGAQLQAGQVWLTFTGRRGCCSASGAPGGPRRRRGVARGRRGRAAAAPQLDAPGSPASSRAARA